MMSCLIILSKCPDLCLIWCSVHMQSGRHVVNIDFQLLSLKSFRKDGEIRGTEILNLNLLHFHNINKLINYLLPHKIGLSWLDNKTVLQCKKNAVNV
jgi:hypothetical protein